MSGDAKKKPKVEVARCLTNIKFSNPVDEAAKKEYPNLYDLLCPRWKDGALVRQPGRLTLRVEGGSYVVSIECPTEGVQTSILAHSLASVLSDLESSIKANLCNWVPTWARRKKFSPSVDDLIE